VRRPAGILVAIAAIVAYVIVLLAIADRTGDGNRRHTVLLNAAYRTNARAGAVSDNGSSLSLAADNTSAAASWDTYSYQVPHLLKRSSSCTVDVALVGVDLTSPDARGVADILANGSVVKRIVFARARRGLFAFAGSRFVPADVTPQILEIVPLDRRYGFLIPLPQRYCSADTLTIGVSVRDATWTIEQSGLILAYTPARFSTLRGVVSTVAGLAAIALAIWCLWWILRRMASIGTPPLIATIVLLALAPLAYDQWDFRLWASFGEFAIFGASDPTYLWYGSPLWTFVPAAFSAITGATFFLLGHGPESWTAIFMKIGMALAYCFSACEIAERAPRRLRLYYALVALLIPVGLYELAGGYREVFAAAAAIASFAAVVRSRLVIATMLAVVAASIAEEFLPLILLPGVAALAGGVSRRALVVASALVAAALVLFLAEWQLLIPHDFAAAALSYRFGPAPLGGASWAGALSALGLLPTWLPVHSPIFGASVLLVLSAYPVLRLVKLLGSDGAMPRDETLREVIGIFVAFVAAFLVAFRGTDPNLWYSLTAITLWYFASSTPLSPLPLILGSVEGLAYYATVGLRDFVNHTFFWPVDTGLLGALSTTRYVLDLMANALMLLLIYVVCRGNRRASIAGATPIVWVVFVLAILSTATETLTLDIVIFGAGALVVGISLYRSARAYSDTDEVTLFPGAGIAVLAGIGAYCGTRSPLAGFSACIACVLALRMRLAMTDIVLLSGAFGIIAVQTGAGAVSRVGYVALIGVLFGILERALRSNGKRDSFLAVGRREIP
jgi:hypothetical protein